MATSTVTENAAATFPAMGAGRLLVFGGIALIAVGMLFGDIFAVFVLHQNGAQNGEALLAATQAVTAKDPAAVKTAFARIGNAMEDRGTKVDTHVHMIDFGYLALLLAVLEPWIGFSGAAKRRIAWIFLFGAWLLPIGVFLIHYVGLAGSPFNSIGWASVFADLGGLLVLLATFTCLAGFWKHLRSAERNGLNDQLLATRVATTSTLLTGGVLLVLLGFFGGAYYAAFDLYRHEAQDFANLSDMTSAAAAKDAATVDRVLGEYGQLQGDKAVKIAAHAHAIEFGLLATMMAFFQSLVNLSERWRRRWAAILLLGSLMLPVCVFFELRYGLLAGAFADIGGLLVILALLAMWIGILRYSGELESGAPRPLGANRT